MAATVKPIKNVSLTCKKCQGKFKNKYKNSLRFSFIFKEGNTFVLKKLNIDDPSSFFWERQVIPVDLLTEI